MRKNKVVPFKFDPFSPKQLKVLTWWLPNSPVKDLDILIADGAVRSGKTVSMSLSYVMWAMETFQHENVGMAGKTIGSFRRNVLAPLKRMLKSLKYRVKEHRTDNMVEISKGGRRNYFYIFGGKDERSQDLIQGITLAGMFFDEVALMPQSFVNQATARCSVAGSKMWFNCNPAGPYHWFKTEYIEQLVEKRALYLHFTMDDNYSLSEMVKERYRRMYTGVFYERYILGLWKMAEGVIYDMFDEKTHKLQRENLPEKFESYYVGVDYGTGNATVFLLIGKYKEKYYVIKEYYYDGRATGKQKTDAEYSADFKRFIEGYVISKVFVDPSAASFITQLKKDRVANVTNALNDVVDGIRTVATALSNKVLYISASCINLLKEFSVYAWDVKAQARGEDKPIKQYDHALDALRYVIFSLRLVRSWKGAIS